MASFSNRFASKRKSLNDEYDVMDSSDSTKRPRTQPDSEMDEAFSSASSGIAATAESHASSMPFQHAPGTGDAKHSALLPQPNASCHPIQSPFTGHQWPPPEQEGGLQPAGPHHFRTESANSTQLQSRYLGQPSPQQLQQRSSVSQNTTWNEHAFRSAAAAIPAGSFAGGSDGAATGMEEDSPAGMRHSNSAPDLHLMLQDSLQSLPRTLLDVNQQPLSSSVIGALVPYTHPVSTKDMVSNALAYQQRQTVLAALQQARREQAVRDTIIEELDSPASPDYNDDPSSSLGATGSLSHFAPSHAQRHDAEPLQHSFSHGSLQPKPTPFAHESGPPFEAGQAHLSGKRSFASALGEAEALPSAPLPPRKLFKATVSDDSPSDMQTG